MTASNDGLQSECIACRKERQANRGEAGKRSAAAHYERTKDHQEAQRKQRVYGLTPEKFARLLEDAGRQCMLAEIGNCAGKLCIDHDHQTGEVRGILCRTHNKALGIFGDSVEGLEKAIGYLR
jgi:hypothetical protein